MALARDIACFECNTVVRVAAVFGTEPSERQVVCLRCLESRAQEIRMIYAAEEIEKLLASCVVFGNGGARLVDL